MTGLVHVGSYVRELEASIERLYENALDWEHLPHLHDGSFSSIEVIEHGPGGWLAEATLANGTPVLLDLRLTDEGWITRTELDGRTASEILTTAQATGDESCRVSVAFHVAGVPEERRASTGAYYERLYARLYDEDERMMIARAEAVRRGPEALRESRRVTLADGSSGSVPLYCPHQGLPLTAEPDADGIVTCPWHGYRYDVRTGRCAPPHALL